MNNFVASVLLVMTQLANRVLSSMVESSCMIPSFAVDGSTVGLLNSRISAAEVASGQMLRVCV